MYQVHMNIEEIDAQNPNLPADIAVINADSYQDALQKVIDLSSLDLDISLVVWQGAGDLVPDDIREALKMPSQKITRSNFNIASQYKVEPNKAVLSPVAMHEDLQSHFDKMNDKAARFGQTVIDDIHAKALTAHVQELCAAFNAHSDVQEYKRLDRFQTCNVQVFFHRDRHNKFETCRVIRNLEGAGTIFMEEKNIGGVGHGGALCLNSWKEATGWMLRPYDMAFMLPTAKGGIGHTWPSKDLNAALFSSQAQRHFESIDITTAAPIFKPR